MAGAGLWARSLLRRHWRASMLLAVLVGVVAGAALTAWQYSLRAATVVDRWEVATSPPDGVVQGCPAGVDPAVDFLACIEPLWMSQLVDAAGASTGVRGVELGQSLPVQVSSGGRTARGVAVHVVEHHGTINETLLVTGRRPESSRRAELAWTPEVADVFDNPDTVSVSPCAWAYEDALGACGNPSDSAVVGQLQPLTDMRAMAEPIDGVPVTFNGGVLLANDALWAALAVGHQPYPTISLTVQPGATLDGIGADVAARVDGFTMVSPDEDRTVIGSLRRSIDLQRTALVVLAVVISLVGAIFAWQLMGRQIRHETGDASAMTAIGATRQLRAVSAALRAVPVAMLAGVLAVVVAIAASPYGPGGSAGRFDPDRGVWIRPTTLAVGFVAVVGWVVLSSVAAVFARQASRSKLTVPTLPQWLFAAFPVVRVGTSFGGRLRSRTVIQAVVAVAVGVGAVNITRVVSDNIEATTTNPQAYGVTWDYRVASANNGSLVDETSISAAITLARGDPAVDAISLSRYAGPVDIDGASLFYAVTWEVVDVVDPDNSSSDSIEPVVISGRLPTAPDEVAFGPRTARELGASQGDTIDVPTALTADSGDGAGDSDSSAGAMATFNVVGEVLISDGDGTSGPGKGALLTPEGFERVVDDGGVPALVVNTDGSRSTAEDIAQLSVLFGPYVSRPIPGVDVIDLEQIRSVPRLVAWFAVMLAIMTMIHALVTLVGSSGRQLSTLRAIGFVRAQTLRSVMALALLIAVPGALLGLLAGIVLGRTMWRAIEQIVGLAPTVTVAAGSAIASAVATVLVGLVLAVVPARSAVNRSRSSAVLREQ